MQQGADWLGEKGHSTQLWVAATPILKRSQRQLLGEQGDSTQLWVAASPILKRSQRQLPGEQGDSMQGWVAAFLTLKGAKGRRWQLVGVERDSAQGWVAATPILEGRRRQWPGAALSGCVAKGGTTYRALSFGAAATFAAAP